MAISDEPDGSIGENYPKRRKEYEAKYQSVGRGRPTYVGRSSRFGSR